MSTLLDALADWSTTTPTAPALRAGREIITYAGLAAASDAAAAAFAARGVAASDRVLVLLPNTPEFVICAFALYKLGAVLVPLNPLLRPDEVAAALEDSGAHLVVVGPGGDPAVVERATTLEAEVVETTALLAAAAAAGRGFAPPSPPSPETLAAILYTSATTGKAKGAMMSHRALQAAANAYRNVLSLTAADRLVAFVPLFHSFGLNVVLDATLLAGGTVVLNGRFEPQAAVDLVVETRVTVICAVTPMFAGMLAQIAQRPQRPDFSAVRLVGGGAASIPPDLAAQMVSVFDAPVVQGWGMSETGAAGSFTRPARSLELGDIGFPVPGVEMKIVDEDGRDVEPDAPGEIWIRGRTLMDGYFRNARATAETIGAEGWLRTGDIGRRRPDGSYRFQDRAKELIKRSGFNVYPAEIEAVLYQHPDVKLAAVLGVPSAQHGEEVAAAVVAKAGQALDVDALREWVKARVAPYKYPRFIVAFAELPLAPSGKILKRQIDRAAFTGARLEDPA